MITAEVQIHGYRKGHQLLASSILLSKDDQAAVDRLSDVAGPLRPKERFLPYLSAYPLPSGNYFVVARTWQDLEVSRAGCVRTKSVLIDTEIWSHRPPINSILDLLKSDELPTEMDAVTIEIEELPQAPLPSVSNLSASELLEALFLEDVRPVVVFDAHNPELVALRLLIALWPDMRRRFALSTFALSPRKISGRDLDLVFAPSNARAKFSDWPGRRVDDRSAQTGRHRWTLRIVRRVFVEPIPRLLSDSEVNLLGDRKAERADLRIALLWEELLDKLDWTPTAALGLLDIANSRFVSNSVALNLLESRLALPVNRAIDSLSPEDAWDYANAMARKMDGHDMPASKAAVERLVAQLAERSPDSAIAFLSQLDFNAPANELIDGIVEGLSNGSAPHVEQVLANAPSRIIARLVSQGGPLTRRLAVDDGFICRVDEVLSDIEPDLAVKIGNLLLPLLVEDRQLPAAIPIFNRMNVQEIVTELVWLRNANNFKSRRLFGALIERARQVDCLSVVRDVLLNTGTLEQSQELLDLTILPIKADLNWLLGEGRLSDAMVGTLLKSVLRRADDVELLRLFADRTIGERIVNRIQNDADDVLVRTTLLDGVPINTFIRVVQYLLPKVSETQKYEIALRAAKKCLRNQFEGDEVEFLCMLFGILGDRIEASWLVWSGLERNNNALIASRNLISYEKAPLNARRRIVEAIDEIARALQGRNDFDLTEEAYDACARLMLTAEKISNTALTNVAGLLVQSLLRASHRPVSCLLVVLFPIIYQKFAKTEEAPSLLNFVTFFELDRARIARRELVQAFMSSSWKASDLALTACRCDDVVRILRRVARSIGGDEYLEKIKNDLSRLNDKYREVVESAIVEVRSDKSSKFDW
jgi:hypothetical protein